MNESRPPSLPGSEPKKGLGITSLVLGILSVLPCISILAGIPAIITGHMARGRAKKEPSVFGGEGFALAGLIMGYTSIALALVMAALLLPALAKLKGRAQTDQCVTNMKQIGLAARIWSNDHNDMYPPDFLTMSNELVLAEDSGVSQRQDENESGGLVAVQRVAEHHLRIPDAQRERVRYPESSCIPLPDS